MTNFFNHWLNLYRFDGNILHNSLAALVYLWLVLFFIRWGRQTIKAREEGTFHLGERIRGLFFVLLATTLFSSLFLMLTAPNRIQNWRFTGWLLADSVLFIIYSVIVLSVVLFIGWQFRKKKLPFKKVIGVLIVGLAVEFVVGSFFLVIFNTGFSRPTLTVESQTLITQQNDERIVVSKVRKVIPNGTSNGISTSVSNFVIRAVELHSGKQVWNHYADWKEYLIGETDRGLFVVNGNKETVYFLDEKTGKRRFTEADLVKEIPELKGNLSYEYTDYAILNDADLYFYGLDNQYYKLNLKNNELSTDSEYEKVIQEHNLFVSMTATNESIEQTQEKVTALYPTLIEATVVSKTDNNQSAFVLYKEKRNTEDNEFAKLSLDDKNIEWHVNVGQTDGSFFSSVTVFSEDKFVYILTGAFLYKLDQKTGEISYRYSYQFNSKGT